MLLKDEWEIYKEKTENPYTYNRYTVLRYTNTPEDIEKMSRKSFIRGWGRSWLSQNDIDYIKYSYEHRISGDWVKHTARTLGVTVQTIHKYKNQIRK